MRRAIITITCIATFALLAAAAAPAYADPGNGNGNGNGDPPAHGRGGNGNGNGAGNSGSPNGANGTVKVHDWPDHKNASDNANDPKVCQFELHGNGFDAGQSGIWWIQAHKWGNGDQSKAVLSGEYASNGSGDWTRGPFSLPDDHYKLFVEMRHQAGNSGNTVTTYKHKVFKVECPPAGNVPGGEQGGEEQGEQGQEEQGQVEQGEQGQVAGQNIRAEVVCVAGMVVTRVFVNESLESVMSSGKSCAVLGVEQPPQAPAQVAGQQAAPLTALPSTSTASGTLILSALLAGLGALLLRRR